MRRTELPPRYTAFASMANGIDGVGTVCRPASPTSEIPTVASLYQLQKTAVNKGKNAIAFALNVR